MQSNLGNTISFLAGLAVGAGLEYILDPEAGKRRRHDIGRASTGAMAGLGAGLAGAAGSLGESLSSAAGSVGQGLAGAGSSALHGTTEAGSKVAGWLADLPGIFGNATASAGESIHDTWDSLASSAKGEEEGFGVSSLLTTAVAAIGVGAVLMYVLDPKTGRTRRKLAGDQIRGRFNHLAERASSTAEDMRNRLSGYAHEARGAMRTEAVDDETLTQRIRSALGHVSDQVGQIMVDVRDGNVTLRGSAADTAADDLLAATRAVTGVQSVDDELTRT